ncbi:hypothetical protein PFZ59_10865 [Streptococcus suis]|uniref:hypothetical protein n=1 Tax=Streptococcus suis TaxID=1307 RepID=UPI00240DB8BB|nr:hypothetical protein [Streptococcus suis]WFA75637.1 hypothetical protein PFZ59_10865 [Streptococcus suis]
MTTEQVAHLNHLMADNGLNLEDFTAKAILDYMEDLEDLKELEQAQIDDDGTRYLLVEVMAELGLTQEDLDNAEISA